MKKETLLVAFSTQKGGAGKTTLTVLMASYFYYVKGMDVVVVDCDYPQYSIKDMRERDIKNIERNPRLKKTVFRTVCQSTEKNVSHSGEPSRNRHRKGKGFRRDGNTAGHHLL